MALFVNIVFLGQAFTIMLVYIWSRRNTYVRMNFFGLMNFQAPYLPWVLLVFSLMLGNSIIVDLMGMYLLCLLEKWCMVAFKWFSQILHYVSCLIFWLALWLFYCFRNWCWSHILFPWRCLSKSGRWITFVKNTSFSVSICSSNYTQYF